MAAGLATLGDDDVHAVGLDRARVLDGRHHRHHLDPALVTAAHHGCVGIAEADRPHRHALLEDDREPLVDEIGHTRRGRVSGRNSEPLAEDVELRLHGARRGRRHARGIDGRTQLGVQPLIDAERAIGHRAHVADAPAKLVGGHAEAGHDAEAAGARDLGRELGAGRAAHAGLHDRVLDAEQLAERGAQAHRVNSSSAISRSFTRCTFSPCGLGVRGTSSTKRTRRGILKEAILPWHHARSSSSVTRASALRMT